MYSSKKMAAILLSALFVSSASLAGCGNSSNSTASQSPASTSGATAAATATPAGDAAKTGQPVTIEFWANKFEDFTNAWFTKWTDEFNKTHPDIHINLTIVPGDAWAQKLKAAQAAGKAPEITTINYAGIAPAAAQGQLMAMDDYVDPKIWTDLYPNVEKFVNVKGKHYAYPKLVEPSAVFYYRKDFFKDAGLDPEKPPTTWDELIADGKKLTKDGRYGLKIAGDAPEFSWTTWGMQMHFGHRPITDDWSKASVMDDGYKQLLTFYKDLYADKIVPKQALKPYVDIGDFGEGKVAMAVSGSWAIGQLRHDFKNILPNVGVAVMPTPDGDQTKPTASLGGWTLAIDGKAQHPKQSAEFISWLLAGDPNIMVDFFKASGWSKFTPRKSVDAAINQDPEAANDQWRKLIAEKIVPYSVAEPTYLWDVSFAFGSAIDRVVKGTQDVDTSLKQADKEINDIIANKKLAGTNPQQ